MQEISKRLHFLSVSLSLDLRSCGQGSCLRITQHAQELLPLTSADCTSSPVSAIHTWGNGQERKSWQWEIEGQCRSVAHQVEAKTGGLVKGQLQWPLAAENGAASLQ